MHHDLVNMQNSGARSYAHLRMPSKMTDALKTAISEDGFDIRFLISLATSPNHSPSLISTEI
jgi:hypothetical protein